MDGAAEFLRLSHTSERSLTDHVCTSLGPASVRVCEEGTVLLGKEESWSYRIYADLLTELLGNLSCEECSEVADAGLGSGLSGNTCHRTECSHAREVHDCAFSLLYHLLEEYL